MNKSLADPDKTAYYDILKYYDQITKYNRKITAIKPFKH